MTRHEKTWRMILQCFRVWRVPETVIGWCSGRPESILEDSIKLLELVRRVAILYLYSRINIGIVMVA